MKKAYLTVLAGFVFLLAAGQQKPQYTQYILNNYILNPALSGIENYTDVKLSHRSQWAGLEGAPVTTYFSIHGPLGKKDYKTTATSFQVPGENPRGTYYWENYTASAPHHGVGFTMVNDKSGLYNRFSANASYAYHVGISPRANLAAGFSAGLINISYNLQKVQFANPNDPVLANAGSSLKSLRPDLSAGLWLYGADYFVGLSAQQVIPQRYGFSDNNALDKAVLTPHFFATAGYRLLLNEDINMLPSVMVKYVPNTPTTPQFDFNTKVQFRDLAWVGGSYRLNDGFAAMVGMNVSNTFNVGYAYDYTTSTLSRATRGTHEIILGFLLGNRYDDSCPRNVW